MLEALGATAAGCLFGYASVLKAQNRPRFEIAVASWNIVPLLLVRRFVVLFVVYELLLAFSLVLVAIPIFVGTASPAGTLIAGVAVGTSLAFVTVQLFLIMFRDRADCGCFGNSGEIIWVSMTRAAMPGLLALPLAMR